MIDRIEREVVLPVPVDRAWAAVTDPELLATWLADEVELELTAGGAARFRVGDTERTGWVEEVWAPLPSGERPAQLVFWWNAEGEPASRVQLMLTPSGDRTTIVRVVETRPLEILDLVGLPVPGIGETRGGPTLVAA